MTDLKEKKMANIAINGFGRIGRLTFRAAIENPNVNLNVVAINDLTTPQQLAHLLKYDSTMGIFKGEIDATADSLIVNGKAIRIYAERDPINLPWKELEIDVVIESTGFFTKSVDARKHITAGAKKVLISAPAKGDDVFTMALGINDDQYDPSKFEIISNASCTTNCLAPISKVLDEQFGIESGLMTTIHSYTGDQRLLDAPHEDLRRARAAALNIVPTSTGAAQAIGLVLPGLKGKLHGFAVRVPTPTVSLVDLTIVTKKPVTTDAINEAMKQASETSLKGILEYSTVPLVSSDFIGNPHSSIFDPELTVVIGERQAKVISWYDNEWGYSNRLAEAAQMIAKKLPVNA